MQVMNPVRDNRTWGWTRRLAVGAGILVAVIAGAVTAASLAPTADEDDLPGFAAEFYPDDSIDVCIWTFGGAKADAAQVAATIGKVKRTDAARDAGLSGMPQTVSEDCDGKPKGGLEAITREHEAASRAPLQFLPVNPAGLVDGKGSIDLWLFVVPQATADLLGPEWLDRRAPWEGIQVDDGKWAEVAGAVALGENDVADEGILRRALALGLGTQTAPVGRPYIDGRCVNADGKDCEADVGH